MRSIIIKLLLLLLSALPLRGAHMLGSALGILLSLIPSKVRRITSINLSLCFPDLTEKEKKQLLRNNLIETGKTLTETGAMWLWNRGRLLPLVRKVTGEEDVKIAFSKGRGAIFLTPHLGCWEIAGLHAAANYPMTILYKPSRLEKFDHLVRTARARTGATMASTTTAGVRVLLTTLARGEVLGILPDQEPPMGTGIFAPFFGVPAYSMTLVSRLAQRTRAPVFIAYCERLKSGDGFHLQYKRIPDTLLHAPLESSVASINQAVEDCVRNVPTQYQWNYKRFRLRPPGSPELYKKTTS